MRMKRKEISQNILKEINKTKHNNYGRLYNNKS